MPSSTLTASRAWLRLPSCSTCGCRGVVSRVITTAGVKSYCGVMAVALVCGTRCTFELKVADGSRLRVVAGAGDGPLHFSGPRQLWVASDDYVFVAEVGNNRVQVLTPTLDFHCFVGVDWLKAPVGVCTNDVVIAVSEEGAHRVSVFSHGVTALFFVASRKKAAVTVSSSAHADCASRPGTVTSQSPTTATAA
jgi:hypothetical protein